MKKILSIVLMLFTAILSFAAENYHIGVVTGSVSQSEDSLRGAEALIKKYGDANNGGKIVHITYPDNFMQEMETTISQMTSLANDPKMKAVVVAEAIPGTVEAFRKIREKRPDIVLIANVAHEDPAMIEEVADLVTNVDNVSRGYLMIKAAQKMGATKFMHISFPRHLSNELLSRRRNIMKVAAADLGVEFIEMSVPDPLSDVGVPGAQQYVLEQVPTWLKKYGNDTAFFATNDAQTEPLLKRVATLNGFFVEASLPSPTMGYPGALGIKFTDAEKGNWPKINKKVEDAVIAAGGGNRMGTWTYSYNFASAISLVEHAMNVIDNGAEVNDFPTVMKAFENNTPNSGWNGSKLRDSKGIESENYFLLYQDTYIFGKGYLKMTDEVIPEKYFRIK